MRIAMVGQEGTELRILCHNGTPFIHDTKIHAQGRAAEVETFSRQGSRACTGMYIIAGDASRRPGAALSRAIQARGTLSIPSRPGEQRRQASTTPNVCAMCEPTGHDLDKCRSANQRARYAIGLEHSRCWSNFGMRRLDAPAALSEKMGRQEGGV